MYEILHGQDIKEITIIFQIFARDHELPDNNVYLFQGIFLSFASPLQRSVPIGIISTIF